jgi:hypothetical protein
MSVTAVPSQAMFDCREAWFVPFLVHIHNAVLWVCGDFTHIVDMFKKCDFLRNRFWKIFKLFWIYLPSVIPCFGIYVPKLCSWTFYQLRYFKGSSIHLHLVLPGNLFASSFITNISMHFSSPSLCYILSILILTLVHLIGQLMVGEEYNHEAPCYVVFSSFLSLSPYEALMFLSAPHSWMPWACFPPIMWQTKFHTHNSKYACLCVFMFIFLSSKW